MATNLELLEALQQQGRLTPPLPEEQPVEQPVQPEPAPQPVADEPVIEVALEGDQEDDGEDRGVLADIGLGVLGGARDFAQSAVDLITDVGHVASFGLLGEGESPFTLPEVPRPETVPGAFAKGITQFALAMIPASRLTSAIGMSAGFAKSMVSGAIADFVAFDEAEHRLANLLTEFDNPVLNNAITQYLAADPDDNWAEGRFKNVLEGLALGTLTEVLYRGVRIVKNRAFLEANPEQLAKEVKSLDDAIKTVGAEPVAAVREIAEEGPMLADDVLKGIRDRTAKAISGEQPWDAVLKDLPLPSDATKFTSETVTGLIDQVGSAVRDASGGSLWDKPQTLNLVRDIAVEMSQDPDLVIKNLSELGSQRETAAATIVAGRNIQNALAQRFLDLAGTDVPDEQLRPILEALAHTTKAIREAASTGGRTVSAFRVSAASDAAARLGSALDEFLATGNIADFRKAAQNVGDPGVLGRFFAKLDTAKGIEKINEFWINSILSGPRTHAINVTSNIIMALVRPFEDALGNVVQGRWAEAADAIAMYGAMGRHFRDSLKMAGRALKKGENILDPIQTVFEHRHAIGTAADSSAVARRFGQIVRTPTRALTAEDEFFKQINYRARVHVKAHREGLARGLRGRELAEYIEDAITKSVDEAGAALDADALAYAERVTFTNPLGHGTIGQGLQELVEQHPLLRQVFPFIRTPTNLLREAWFHMPGIGLLGKRYRAQWFASPAARATMIGRQMVGTALLGSAFMLAANGRITGAAPKDPNLRDAWLAEHPAYSIKIGDKWYPYDRLDPLGLILGLAADWMTIAAETTPADSEEFGSALLLAIMDRLWGDSPADAVTNVTSTIAQSIMAAARSVENRIYLQSAAELLATIESGDADTWERWMRNRLGSFVPNFLRQTNPDPYFREVRGYLDELMARTPGMSDRVEPRFDALGRPILRPGDPISRLLPSPGVPSKDDPIFREVNRLGMGFAAMQDKRGEVDLTKFRSKDGKTAYYLLNEEIRNSGLEAALNRLIQSESYQKLSDSIMAGLDDVQYTGSKVAAIRKVLNTYREAAWNRLLIKHGRNLRSKSGLTLFDAWRNDRMNRTMALAPGQEMLPVE